MMGCCQQPRNHVIRESGPAELGANISPSGYGSVDTDALRVLKAVLRFNGHVAMIPRTRPLRKERSNPESVTLESGRLFGLRTALPRRTIMPVRSSPASPII